MQVLEVASKTMDTASGFVSYSGYFLAGMAFLITLVSILVQCVGNHLKNRAVSKAVDRALARLATDEGFATQVLQEIMKKQQLSDYLLTQADQSIQAQADAVLTKEYFENKMTALSVRWEQAAAAQTSSSGGNDL